MLSTRHDAYGHLVYDYLRGLPAVELVERDDGWIAPSGGPATYFAPFAKWPLHQRRAMALVQGRVLDIGCGAGRAALYLQEEGHSVLAVDNSPLAVRTGRLRGVRQARVRGITELTSRLGVFDTILLLGSNFGLLANPKRARWLLGRFRAMTANRIRVRYKDWATPWFDYLFVSQPELRSILKGTGWGVERIIRSTGPTYMAILARL